MLQRFDDGTLYADDEVLPNPKHPDRALVVLRDAGPTGERIKKHVSSVIEVSANGKGIDMVTAMTARDGSLKEARKLKQEIQAGKVGEAKSGGAAYPSSSLSGSLANQHHAAADFPAVAQDLTRSIDPAVSRAQSSEQATSPITAAAARAVDGAPDMMIRMEDGTDISARDALQQANDDIARAQADSRGIIAAVTCFLRTGG